MKRLLTAQLFNQIIRADNINLNLFDKSFWFIDLNPFRSFGRYGSDYVKFVI